MNKIHNTNCEMSVAWSGSAAPNCTCAVDLPTIKDLLEKPIEIRLVDIPHEHDWHYGEPTARYREDDSLFGSVIRFCSDCREVEILELNKVK